MGNAFNKLNPWNKEGCKATELFGKIVRDVHYGYPSKVALLPYTGR
jgi:hypothetical protein